MIVDHALDALLECLLTEIHQQAERLIGQSEVCQELLGIEGNVALGRFQLDDQAIIDE